MDFLRLRGTPAEVVAALRAWLAAGDPPPLLVETSGSSGRPKRVVLPPAAVLASVTASARRVGGTGPWLLALPASYVAGLQVVCRSLVAGHDPVLLAPGQRVADAIAAHPGVRFTSLVPTQAHRMLQDAGEASALADLDTVLVGGGPVDPALRRRAAAAGVRLVATYGASETAGGCVYDGYPLDGVAVALGTGGRIRISGPTLFTGYDGDPALTAASLVDGWFLTEDAGRLDEDARIQVLGRLDDVVVSGGVNVPLAAVAARLREHPGVAAAEVLGVPDPEWGQRMVAFVVPAGRVEGGAAASGPGDLVAELRDWVAGAHPRSWSPRQVVRLDALPLLGNGKVDRVRLRGLA